MRRRLAPRWSVGLAALAATLLTVTLAVGPAGAVTNGTLDGDGHPYVGLMVAKDASGAPLWRCSGTLLSPTVYLTAGHCTESPAASAEIWFGDDLTNAAAINYPNEGDVSGKTYLHPGFDPDDFSYRDLGVVVLDEPYVLPTYGALPSLNQLDALRTQRGQKDLTFTAVGYGLQRSFPDAATWKNESKRVRMVATPKLLQVNTGFTGDYSVLLSNNTNTGGTCFGDSGGPNFVGDSNVVGGVTSFGMNPTCGGTGGVFRMDRDWSLDWVNSFLD